MYYFFFNYFSALNRNKDENGHRFALSGDLLEREKDLKRERERKLKYLFVK